MKTGTELRIKKSHFSYACLSHLLTTSVEEETTRSKYLATLVLFLPFCMCSFLGLLTNTVKSSIV